jgi:hypothetical protein
MRASANANPMLQRTMLQKISGIRRFELQLRRSETRIKPLQARSLKLAVAQLPAMPSLFRTLKPRGLPRPSFSIRAHPLLQPVGDELMGQFLKARELFRPAHRLRLGDLRSHVNKPRENTPRCLEFSSFSTPNPLLRRVQSGKAFLRSQE